jgi:hypothetical protein
MERGHVVQRPELRLALPERKHWPNLSGLTLTNGLSLRGMRSESTLSALDEGNRVIGGPGGAAVPSSEADTLQ